MLVTMIMMVTATDSEEDDSGLNILKAELLEALKDYLPPQNRSLSNEVTIA